MTEKCVWLFGFWYALYDLRAIEDLEEEDREGLVWAFVSYDLDTRFPHAQETIVGLRLYEHDTRFTN